MEKFSSQVKEFIRDNPTRKGAFVLGLAGGIYCARHYYPQVSPLVKLATGCVIIEIGMVTLEFGNDAMRAARKTPPYLQNRECCHTPRSRRDALRSQLFTITGTVLYHMSSAIIGFGMGNYLGTIFSSEMFRKDNI